MKHLQRLDALLVKRLSLIEKRLRFVISVVVLTGLMLVSTLFYFDKLVFFIPAFFLMNYATVYFSVLEGIEHFEWFSLFFMPLALTISSYLFYFLFPARWITRLIFIIFFAISYYALLLCSNIFNVGVEKSLQLYRAAFSVNFFYQTILSFLVLNTLLSFHLNFFLNGLAVGGLIFLFALQLLWTVKLNHHLQKDIMIYALFIALIIGQLAIVVSFLPVKLTIASLLLTASYYSLTGFVYNLYDQRLFKETVREYAVVFVFAVVITLLSISW